MMMSPMIKTGRIGTEVLVGVLAGLSVVVCVWQEVEARDLFAPKEQVTTEVDPTQSPSFDEQKKGIPQSLFTWIKMAKGYDIEWDTFGRKGWYTQDPRLKPGGPVSEAWMAICEVSRSRISPTMITSGSCRRKARNALPKVMPTASLIATCMIPSMSYSTGSSAVSSLESMVLMRRRHE